MRAYVLHQPEGGGDGVAAKALKLVDRPDPEPGPGEVEVAVKAVSLNYRDLTVASGRFTGGAVPEGLIPLSDGAGEVVATGAGVTRFAPGDRVAAAFMPGWVDGGSSAGAQATSLGGGTMDGMLAEAVVMPETGLVRLPEHLSCEAGATLPCAAVTAWYALYEGATVKPGDTVLLLGTGGVSIFALQFAKLGGARVILTSSNDAKLERARALGADETINYRAVPEWHERVLELTRGRGVDLAVEVGGPGTLSRTLKAVRVGGSISLMGVLTGFADQVETGLILRKNIKVQGTYVGSVAMFERMNRAIALHRLEPVIDRIFPFAEAPQAYAHLDSGRHVGKVVICIGG